VFQHLEDVIDIIDIDMVTLEDTIDIIDSIMEKDLVDLVNLEEDLEKKEDV